MSAISGLDIGVASHYRAGWDSGVKIWIPACAGMTETQISVLSMN
jgi:hypothetical protein